MSGERQAFTVAEVAKSYGVSDATVRQWIAGGKIRAYQLPGSKKQAIYRIKARDLEMFDKVHRMKATVVSITDCA